MVKFGQGVYWGDGGWWAQIMGVGGKWVAGLGGLGEWVSGGRLTAGGGKLRAGHARPLRGGVNELRAKGVRGWLPLPFSPTKTKKRDGHCPVSFFLKKKEKNRTSRRRLNANGTTPLQVIPSLRIRQGALVFFLFSCRSEALAFDVLIVHYFCRICKMRTCTTCYIYPTLFCIVCTIVHG